VLANINTRTPAVLLMGFEPSMQEEYRTARKIFSFRNLPLGWHYGQGGPISMLTISRALDVYMAFLIAGFPRTDAFAGAGREVLVTAYHGTDYIGVITESDGQMSLRHESADEERFYREKMVLFEVKQKISELAGQILWSSYVSSIPGISIERETDSMIYHSRTLRAESPSFIGNAWMAFRALSATT
jgi:hypothetical protein